MANLYKISNKKRYQFTPGGQVDNEYHDLKYWVFTKSFKFSWKNFKFIPYKKWNWVTVYTTRDLTGTIQERIQKIQKEYDSFRKYKKKSL